MKSQFLRFTASVSAVMLAVVLLGGCGSSSDAGGTKPVSYGGVRFSVPNDWAVITATANTSGCPNGDDQVFLGLTSNAAFCAPVSAADVKQKELLYVEPLAEPVGASSPTTLPIGSAWTAIDSQANSRTIGLPAQKIQFRFVGKFGKSQDRVVKSIRAEQ